MITPILIISVEYLEPSSIKASLNYLTATYFRIPHHSDIRVPHITYMCGIDNGHLQVLPQDLARAHAFQALLSFFAAMIYIFTFLLIHEKVKQTTIVQQIHMRNWNGINRLQDYRDRTVEIFRSIFGQEEHMRRLFVDVAQMILKLLTISVAIFQAVMSNYAATKSFTIKYFAVYLELTTWPVFWLLYQLYRIWREPDLANYVLRKLRLRRQIHPIHQVIE